MSLISSIELRGLFLLVTVFALTACGGGQNYTHLDPTKDMGARPGLLSGDRGYLEYTIQKPLREREEEADESAELFLPFEDY